MYAFRSQLLTDAPCRDDTSVQRIDPIVSPGGVAEHVHQLFGASGLSQTLTYDKLQSSKCSTLGAADGRENLQDKSIYWVPSLYMEANDGGYLRLQTNGHKTYYIDTGEGEPVEPFEFPPGFEMIAGSPTNRGPLPNDAVTWTCYSGGANEGSQGGFPQGVSTCETYPYLNAEIEFPREYLRSTIRVIAGELTSVQIAGTARTSTQTTQAHTSPTQQVTSHEAAHARAPTQSAYHIFSSRPFSHSTPRPRPKSSPALSSLLKVTTLASASTLISLTDGTSVPFLHSSHPAHR